MPKSSPFVVATDPMNLEAPNLSGLHAVDSGTLGQRVYTELRDFLMVGGVKPGEKITLRQLTSAFGTSLMPVREAVQRLAAEGALEVLPNRAIRVPIVTKAGVREILKVRLTAGGPCGRRSRRPHPATAVAQLEQLNEAFTSGDARPSKTQRDRFASTRNSTSQSIGLPRCRCCSESSRICGCGSGRFCTSRLGVRGREATRKVCARFSQADDTGDATAATARWAALRLKAILPAPST